MFFKEAWPSAEKKAYLRSIGKFCYSSTFVFFMQLTFLLILMPSILLKMKLIYRNIILLDHGNYLKFIVDPSRVVEQDQSIVISAINTNIKSLFFYVLLLLLLTVILILVQSRAYFSLEFKKLFKFQNYFSSFVNNFIKLMILTGIYSYVFYRIFVFVVKSANNLPKLTPNHFIEYLINFLSAQQVKLFIFTILMAFLAYLFKYIVFLIKNRMNPDEHF